MFTLDLKNQFFPVQLNSDYKKYFGFKLPNESGLNEYYQFKIMTYGIWHIKTSKTFFTSLGNMVYHIY